MRPLPPHDLHELLWLYCTTLQDTKAIGRRFGLNAQDVAVVLNEHLTQTTRRAVAARKRSVSPLIWRRRPGVACRPVGWLPSPAEIERMKQEIRDGWDVSTSRGRWDRKSRVPAGARGAGEE